MNDVSRFLVRWHLPVAAVLACGVGLLAAGGPARTLLVVLFLAFLCLLVYFPRGLVLMVLFVRPAIDLWSDTSFYSKGIYARINPNAIISIIIILSLGFMVTRSVSENSKVNLLKAPLILPMFLFIIYIILTSIYLSSNYILAISDCIRIITIFCFYALCYKLFYNPFHIKAFVLALLGSSLAPMGFGFYQYITGEGGALHFGTFYRIVGTFLNPPSFSHYLALVCLLAIAFWLHGKIWIRGLRVFLPAALACLILTYGRGAWIGFLAGIFMLLILVKDGRKWVKIIGLLLIIIFFTALFLPQIGSLVQRSFDFYNVQESSVATRLLYWQILLPVFWEHPFFGIGLKEQYTLFAFVPHNDYLRLLIETGLAGFSLYMWIIGLLVWKAGQAVRAYPPATLMHGLSLGFIMVMACHLTISMGDSLLTTLVLQYPLWGLAGLLHRAQAESNDADRPG